MLAASYWITWFPASVLAVLGILAIVWKGVQFFVRLQDALPTLLKAAAELDHNGGSSVKDHVTALTSNLLQHTEQDAIHFSELRAQIEALSER